MFQQTLLGRMEVLKTEGPQRTTPHEPSPPSPEGPWLPTHQRLLTLGFRQGLQFSPPSR